MQRAESAGKPGVDWTELRRRMDAIERAIAGVSALAPERVAGQLEQRARALARPVIHVGPVQAPRLMSFTMAGERYGVDLRRVREICRIEHLAPLPPAESWVAGLAGWRGELVLAIDLRALIGAPVSSLADRRMLVVLGDRRPAVGLLVDAPGELLPLDDLRPPPQGIAGKEYIAGMTADAVVVLDVDRVLGVVGSEPD
jgi:purine-binding chemotaxis protein CheW